MCIYDDASKSFIIKFVFLVVFFKNQVENKTKLDAKQIVILKHPYYIITPIK